ncbi:hypothetical protein [Alicyclobacillus sp.]|uniref:hypothetical protein n=1 Tax=Alicyclobacillus sp. TaxID=61169 RepID=UPI0025BB9E8C|nr:hypothetical protein [Alicyclobacillus sp.]MCL6517139.1 hypothetical protein [Alicyclobacillus sp.]
MKRTNWLLVVLVVLAFVWFRHSGAPSLPMPGDARVQGATVQIPVTMTPATTSEAYWNLAKRGGQTYVVQVSQARRVVAEFPAEKPIADGSDGTDYTAGGRIQLDGTWYRADRIHVNSDGTSGYLELRREAATNQP